MSNFVQFSPIVQPNWLLHFEAVRVRTDWVVATDEDEVLGGASVDSTAHSGGVPPHHLGQVRELLQAHVASVTRQEVQCPCRHPGGEDTRVGQKADEKKRSQSYECGAFAHTGP